MPEFTEFSSQSCFELSLVSLLEENKIITFDYFLETIQVFQPNQPRVSFGFFTRKLGSLCHFPFEISASPRHRFFVFICQNQIGTIFFSLLEMKLLSYLVCQDTEQPFDKCPFSCANYKPTIYGFFFFFLVFCFQNERELFLI